MNETLGGEHTKKNIVAKIRPASPTKPAAIPPTTAEVLVLLVGAAVELAVAEDVLLDKCVWVYCVTRATEVMGDEMGVTGCR